MHVRNKILADAFSKGYSPSVPAGIDIDLGVVKIGRQSIARAKNGASLVISVGRLQLIEEGLVAVAPVVHGVVDLGNFVPGLTQVVRAEDGIPHERWFGRVVLPGGKESILRFQVQSPGVKSSGDDIIGGRGEDGDILNGLRNARRGRKGQGK